ncbi:5-oxoprolinase subunit PxpB [Alcaligenaceae bacterium]|nr:5-oxoprolinase subunit PxpB [Alcaligenaceae bacterium]
MLEQPEHKEWSIAAHGDRCLVIRFGTGLDAATGRRCGAAAAALRRAALDGVSDIVPTFNTVAVHYLPGRHTANTSLRKLELGIEEILRQARLDSAQTGGRLVELPVCYGGEFGPDLRDVAERLGMSESSVVQRHSREPLYVFMLGFAPGAPFMGVLDEDFALARRDTPRTAVPAGSVAVANRQTIVYPNELPGGWHVIGRTPLRLFDPLREPATLIAPGDSVRLVPITQEAFHGWPGQ